MASDRPPPTLTNLPDCLKHLKHYLKIAEDHDKKNKIISYYCRCYVMQRAIEKQMTPKTREYLMSLMDYMEQFKKDNPDEGIHNEVIGQAVLEDYALKIFQYADNEDRAARFNKTMIKSFFTAGLLLDVSAALGDLSEDLTSKQKYAKWKATYIHKCIQSGETPIAGPIGGDPETESQDNDQYLNPTMGGPGGRAPPTTPLINDDTLSNFTSYTPRSNNTAACTSPVEMGEPIDAAPAAWMPKQTDVKLTQEQFNSAIKTCNHAVSALRYEDTSTAIDLLQKCLSLLATGKE